ncbi:MAG: hypothetical protein AB8V75_03525 [Coxiella endosymbiont of Dermacentor nuttalli]
MGGVSNLSKSSVSIPIFQFGLKDEESKTDSLAKLDENLKNNARNNDDYSIDCLFTMACEPTPLGREAEKFLFDLYTGKETKDFSLKKQLGRDSLRLYEIVEKRNFGKSPNDVWVLPEKLLIMAGFTANSISQQQANIAEKIDKQTPHMAAFIDVGNQIAGPINTSFFDSNRLSSAAEINASIEKINRKYPKFNFFDTRAISTIDVSNQKLSSELVLQLNALNDISLNTVRGNFVPLLFRDHWVLFGVFFSSEGHKTSTLFDSADYLNANEISYIKALSDKLGSEKVVFINKNIQTNLPNSCALLLTKAMESIAEKDNIQPHIILSDFAKNISVMSLEEQDMFNRHGRAELYGNVLDQIR